MKSLSRVVRPFTVVAVSLVLLCGLATAAETGSTLSKKEVKKLLATANTPADHQKVADYYRTKAQRLNAKAQADYLATQPATVESKQGISGNTASHYRYWSKQYAQEARESETLAAQQEQLTQNYQARAARK